MQKITNFLMFNGEAEDAMNFYTSIFPESEIGNVNRYSAGGPGPEGTIMHATFLLNGQTFMCIDSYVKHAFTFTPALSLYINCNSETELEMFYSSLADKGTILMPLDAYPFSKKYAWLNDRFGVSWQLNLA